MSPSPDLNRCEQSEATCTLEVLPGSEAKSRGKLIGKRLLVVEDKFLIALDMTAALENAGAEVTWTGCADEAMHTIEAKPLDAVLLNGALHGKLVEIAAALTRFRVPFLFVTGYARECLPQAFRKAALLSKPFTQKQLLEAAAGLVERRGDKFDDVDGTCPLPQGAPRSLDAFKDLEPPAVLYRSRPTPIVLRPHVRSSDPLTLKHAAKTLTARNCLSCIRHRSDPSKNLWLSFLGA